MKEPPEGSIRPQGFGVAVGKDRERDQGSLGRQHIRAQDPPRLNVVDHSPPGLGSALPGVDEVGAGPVGLRNFLEPGLAEPDADTRAKDEIRVKLEACVLQVFQERQEFLTSPTGVLRGGWS